MAGGGAEQSGVAGKGKGKAVEQGTCEHCERRGIECVPPTEGKATTCVACQLARVKCVRPGEESAELKVICRRKCTEDESPQEKKKWVCMVELEGAKGLEGTRRFQRLGWGMEKGVAETGPSGSGGELALLIWGLFCCLNEQNLLLGELVGLKEWEVVVRDGR